MACEHGHLFWWSVYGCAWRRILCIADDNIRQQGHPEEEADWYSASKLIRGYPYARQMISAWQEEKAEKAWNAIDPAPRSGESMATRLGISTYRLFLLCDAACVHFQHHYSIGLKKAHEVRRCSSVV